MKYVGGRAAAGMRDADWLDHVHVAHVMVGEDHLARRANLSRSALLARSRPPREQEPNATATRTTGYQLICKLKAMPVRQWV